MVQTGSCRVTSTGAVWDLLSQHVSPVDPEAPLRAVRDLALDFIVSAESRTVPIRPGRGLDSEAESLTAGRTLPGGSCRATIGPRYRERLSACSHRDSTDECPCWVPVGPTPVSTRVARRSTSTYTHTSSRSSHWASHRYLVRSKRRGHQMRSGRKGWSFVRNFKNLCLACCRSTFACSTSNWRLTHGLQQLMKGYLGRCRGMQCRAPPGSGIVTAWCLVPHCGILPRDLQERTLCTDLITSLRPPACAQAQVARIRMH